MTHPRMFSFCCSTLRYNKVADVIFLVLQILLFDSNEKADVFFEERYVYEMMLGGLKNQRYL